jgi:tetratricopeptide (TPR) repeat protein
MNRKQRRAQAKDQRSSAPISPARAAPEMEALFDEAVRHHEMGRLPDAEQLYRQVLARAPRHAPALHMLGVIAHQVGDNRTAVDLIGAAIRIRPDFAEAHYNRGLCLKDLGRPDEALAAYDAALRFRPDLAEAHANRGACLKDLGRAGEALAACDAAIRIRPHYAEAHANRGACLKDLGRPSEALGACDVAVRIRPEFAEAHANRGACLKDLGRFVEALAACDTALRLRPDDAGAHANRGACLKDLGRPGEALAACDAAVRIRPDYAEAHANRGACLNDLGRLDAALAAADRAIALEPDLVDAHANRGAALDNLGRLEEALAAYDRAVSLNPLSAEAHHNRALTLLRAGDLAAGFAEYRWRWKTGDVARHRPQVKCPEWEGEPLAGKRLLVFAEQGYGDTLQFARYVSLAEALGAEVTVLVDPALRRLIAASLAGVRVVDSLPGDAEFDAKVAMLCLPRLFGTTLDTIPGRAPYLVADADRAARWAARLRAMSGRRVGLVWAGAARRHDPRAAAIDARRSLRLAQLAPLASAEGVQFVSLQIGEPAVEARAAPAGMRLVDWTSEIGDFADTAALVAGLDLVITVDTAVAHLAGALGRPVWILSRYDGCWRWLKDRETSPWYPTARLFHQAAPGAWGPVVEAVGAALSAIG